MLELRSSFWLIPSTEYFSDYNRGLINSCETFILVYHVCMQVYAGAVVIVVV